MTAEQAHELNERISEILGDPSAAYTYTDVIAMQQQLLDYVLSCIEALEATNRERQSDGK